jgi:predicted nuclease of predicted toxin-antitoxin system
MKIVLDMNLSPAWVSFLETAGHKVKHWSEIGAITAPDTEIMEWARSNGYVVFTHDLDFSALLFATKAIAPSVIQVRTEDLRPNSIGTQVLLALQNAEETLKQGVLITIDLRKNRIRLLPLKREKSFINHSA